MAEAAALLRSLADQVAGATEHARALLERVRSGRLDTEKGIPLLGLRAFALLQYLSDLGLLLAAKAAGTPLGGTSAPLRLSETRVVLEKLRPMERQLRYHVEKLLRATGTGGRDPNDPLSFRPRPTDMATEQEEEEEEAAAPKAPGLGGGKRYVPPRLVPVTYDSMGQRRRHLGVARALSSSLIRELKREMGEGPEEEPGGGATGSPAHNSRTRLEESLLLRLGRGRKGRDRKGRGPEGRGLDGITHFGDVSALLDPTNQEAPPPKRKKLKKPKKGRGFRKRRR